MSSETDEIFKLLRAGPAFQAYKADTKVLLDLLRASEATWTASPGLSEDLRRRIHSVRGSSGFFGLTDIQAAAQDIDRVCKQGGEVNPILMRKLKDLLEMFFQPSQA